MKHIIIIGKGFGCELAPPLSEGHEIWGINNVICWREVDLAFFMDRRDVCAAEDKPTATQEFDETMWTAAERGTPVIVSDGPADDYGDAKIIRYPLREVLADVGHPYINYSIDYMLAYAIHIKVDKIDTYGVNMQYSTSYRTQIPSSEYWIGFARGRGIEVNLNGPLVNICPLPNKMYGYGRSLKEILGE